LPNWSARLEYDFLGLNSQSHTVTATIPPGAGSCPGGGGACPFTDTLTVNNRDIQTLTLGINYLFH